jgi:hypothetical protein
MVRSPGLPPDPNRQAAFWWPQTDPYELNWTDLKTKMGRPAGGSLSASVGGCGGLTRLGGRGGIYTSFDKKKNIFTGAVCVNEKNKVSNTESTHYTTHLQLLPLF